MYLTHFSVLDRKLYTKFIWIWGLIPLLGFSLFTTLFSAIPLMVLTLIPITYMGAMSPQLKGILLIGMAVLIVVVSWLFESHVTDKLGRKSARLFIRRIKPSIPGHLLQKTLDVWHKEAVDAEHIKEMVNYNLIYLFGKHKDKPVLQRWTFLIARYYPDALKNFEK